MQKMRPISLYILGTVLIAAPIILIKWFSGICLGFGCFAGIYLYIVAIPSIGSGVTIIILGFLRTTNVDVAENKLLNKKINPGLLLVISLLLFVSIYFGFGQYLDPGVGNFIIGVVASIFLIASIGNLFKKTQ